MALSSDLVKLFRCGIVRSTPLTLNYNFKEFDCGNNDLNDFLLSDSKIYLRHLRYTTTIIDTEDQILAYYSLANDLLNITDKEDFQQEMDIENSKIHPDYWEKFLNQKMYPAVKLGRLAVHKDYQCNGMGEFILQSLTHSFVNNNKTGCQFLTIDAINDHKEQRALNFYEKQGFKYLTVRDIGEPSRAMYKSLIECIL